MLSSTRQTLMRPFHSPREARAPCRTRLLRPTFVCAAHCTNIRDPVGQPVRALNETTPVSRPAVQVLTIAPPPALFAGARHVLVRPISAQSPPRE
jgi:hypothetical protein